MREPVKFTDAFARSAPPGIYFDHHPRSVPGFMLRVTRGNSAAARSWCLNYRLRDSGRERRITIGSITAWPVAEARKKAADLRRIVDERGDPLGERQERRAAPTVAELAARFENESLSSRALSTQTEYRAMLRDYILPALGRRKVADISREDVERLHRQMTADGKPGRANRTKSLVSTLFAQAIEWRMVEKNPAARVPGNREHSVERYLDPQETERLVEVIARWRVKSRHIDSVDAITLLMLTGARRGEVLSMSWSDVDLRAGVWTKPPLRVKQRRRHRVPLSEAATEILQRRHSERDGKIVRLRDAVVFEGGNTKEHQNRFEEHWRQIRAAADLDNFRCHDLRHSFASILVSQGQSLPVIGALLGHSQPTTTDRYAHLSDSPLRDAAERVAKVVRGQRP